MKRLSTPVTIGAMLLGSVAVISFSYGYVREATLALIICIVWAVYAQRFWGEGD